MYDICTDLINPLKNIYFFRSLNYLSAKFLVLGTTKRSAKSKTTTRRAETIMIIRLNYFKLDTLSCVSTIKLKKVNLGLNF